MIAPRMPVICSAGSTFAEVDHLEGTDTIKLKRDEKGKHHYIPTRWVTQVDDKVHIDRPAKKAMQDWSSEPPPGTPVEQTETGSSL